MKTEDAQWLRGFAPTFLALGLLWAVLVYQLGSLLWATYHEYAYGWSVPFLSLYLLWLRWETRPEPGRSSKRTLGYVSLGLLLLGFLPVRIIQEANLVWLVTAWAMSLLVVAITLVAVWIAGGWPWLRHIWFPICFFLIAVPWPVQVEGPVSGFLAGANTACTIELLVLSGNPAIRHGNVIEVSSGMVGVDEACSGIRSFHAVLMIALFLGELRMFSRWRRIVLLVSGLGLAFACNIIRTLILALVSAQKGMTALGEWHDPTGITVLLVCFAALWGLSVWWKKAKEPDRNEVLASNVSPAEEGREWEKVDSEVPGGGGPRSITQVQRERCTPIRNTKGTIIGAWYLPTALIGWLIIVEIATQTWYWAHDRYANKGVLWSVRLPAERPNFRQIQASRQLREELDFDKGQGASWREPDGSAWQFYAFEWSAAGTRSGAARVQRAMTHEPERCLTMSGKTRKADFGIRLMATNGVTLPLRCYCFMEGERQLHVFFCYWHEGTDPNLGRDSAEAIRLHPRLVAAWSGNRAMGRGLRSLEFAVLGYGNVEQAAEKLKQVLGDIIVTEEKKSVEGR